MLVAPAALAQSGQALLESKAALGCHGLDEKKMGPHCAKRRPYSGAPGRSLSQR